MVEKLALILDFNFLESSNLSLIEFITLLKINYDQIDLEINNNVLNNFLTKKSLKHINFSFRHIEEFYMNTVYLFQKYNFRIY